MDAKRPTCDGPRTTTSCPREAARSRPSVSPAAAYGGALADFRALSPGSPPPSKGREVALQLPLGQLHAVLVPFAALELDVALEDVRTKRLASHLRGSE